MYNRNYPAIIAVKGRWTKFMFSYIEKTDLLKNIKNSQGNKLNQGSDTLTTLINYNSDLFIDFIFTNLSISITQSTFLS